MIPVKWIWITLQQICTQIWKTCSISSSFPRQSIGFPDPLCQLTGEQLMKLEAWSLVLVEHVDVNDCKCLLIVIRPILGKEYQYYNSVRCHPFPDIFSWNTEENWGVYPLPCHSATAMAIDGWIFTSHRYFPTGWGPWRYWSYGFYNLKTIAGYGSIPIDTIS